MSGFTAAETEACRPLAGLAVAEDFGDAGDRTSLALIPAGQQATAYFVARTAGVLAGLPTLAIVATAVDPLLLVTLRVPDGTEIHAGQTLAEVSGPLLTMLGFERTALNFLQRLSGIATLTCTYVRAIEGFRCVLLDTRKTTPGWRLLEKYAVRMGGGTNHRTGLYDGILIKDNHLAGLGGDIGRAIKLARSYPGNERLPVEVEVDRPDQLEAALAAGADLILLDNMPPVQIRAAVSRRNAVAPRTLLEASGGVNLATIREIAATGVDRISVGALTHSAPALDIGLDYSS